MLSAEPYRPLGFECRTATGTSGDVAVIDTGIDIFRIANGRLAELWQSTDDYGLAQQLSQIPSEATPAAETPTT